MLDVVDPDVALDRAAGHPAVGLADDVEVALGPDLLAEHVLRARPRSGRAARASGSPWCTPSRYAEIIASVREPAGVLYGAHERRDVVRAGEVVLVGMLAELAAAAARRNAP